MQYLTNGTKVIFTEIYGFQTRLYVVEISYLIILIFNNLFGFYTSGHNKSVFYELFSFISSILQIREKRVKKNRPTLYSFLDLLFTILKPVFPVSLKKGDLTRIRVKMWLGPGPYSRQLAEFRKSGFSGFFITLKKINKKTRFPMVPHGRNPQRKTPFKILFFIREKGHFSDSAKKPVRRD